jgi:hypothetical protein
MVHGRHELVSVSGRLRRGPAGGGGGGEAEQLGQDGEEWSGQSEQAAVRLVPGWMPWDTSWRRMSSVAR